MVAAALAEDVGGGDLTAAANFGLLALWALSVSAAALPSEPPAESTLHAAASALFFVAVMSSPLSRARATRAATLRLGSPGGPSSRSAARGGRRTSTCRSMRSSNGPETLLR